MTILLEDTKRELLAKVRLLYSAYVKATKVSESRRHSFLASLLALDTSLTEHFEILLHQQFFLSSHQRAPLMSILRRRLSDSPTKGRISPAPDTSANEVDDFMTWFEQELDQHIAREESALLNSFEPSDDEVYKKDDQDDSEEDELFFQFNP
ncbi:MAG: hypothetical protein K0U37_06030 [Gammaproteobacteria bacterium]|nr:hypothetical protein [Gammaproteobacteria bacterium]